MKNISAETLAAAINNNCDAYHRRDIDRKTWSAEQNRLWRLAAENVIASEVMRLVCPSLAVAR